MLYFPQICNHTRGCLYIYRNNQLISVNIFIVCKRRQNKTTSGNSAFFIFFCLEGICRSRLGILLTDPTRPPRPPPPPPLLAHRSCVLAGTRAIPPTKATFFFFFFTARSDASDLLSDVAWMIQTKTNALEFKNRS